MTGVRYVEVLGADYKPAPIGWLVEGLVPATGLVGIHGQARSGRTSLSLQLAKSLRSEHPLLGHRVLRPARLTIFAQNTFALNRYHQAFRSDEGVQIARLGIFDVDDLNAWRAAQDVCEGHQSELVIFDAMPNTTPEQVEPTKQQLDLFGRPVVGIFNGFGGTQSIRPDNWRSEMSTGVHLFWEKTSTVALGLHGPAIDRADIRVSWNGTTQSFLAVDEFGNPILPPLELSAQQVRELGQRAKFFPGQSRDVPMLAKRLTQEDANAVEQICQTVPDLGTLIAAIERHPEPWSTGLRGFTPPPETDEPPF